MSTVEGAVYTAFAIGVLGFVATKIGFTIASKFDEKKGYIGTIVVFFIAGVLLWINAPSVASYLNASRSEVELVAIFFFIIPLTYALIRNRERVKSSMDTTRSISTKARTTTQKAKSRLGRKA